MTPGGPVEEPAQQHAAAADTTPHAGPVPDPAAVDGTAEPAAQAEAEPAAPEDAQQLRQEIEQTRKQLGETVEQLAAKADVKSRVRDKAAAAAGRVKTATARTRGQAAACARDMPARFAGTTAAAALLILGVLMIRQVRKK